MAVEIEASGQVDEFLRILRRRIWWIVVPTALIGSIGIFFAVIVPKKYVSNAEVMVRNLDASTGAFGQNVSAVEGQVATFNIRSHARIDSVLNGLKWPDYRPLDEPQKFAYRQKLLRDLSVSLPKMGRDTGRQIVGMEYKNTDPGRAVKFLAALKKSWTEEVLRRHLNQETKEVQETSEAIKANTIRLSEIRNEQTRIRTDNQISPPLRTPNGLEEPRPKAYDDLTAMETKIQALEEEITAEEFELDLKIKLRDRLPVEAETSVIGATDPITRQIEAIDERIATYEQRIDEGGWRAGHSARELLEAKIRAERKQRLRLVNERAGVGFTSIDAPKNQERLALTKEIEEESARLESKRERLAESKIKRGRLTAETQKLNEAFKDLDELEAEKTELTETNRDLSVKLANLNIQRNTLDSEQGNPFEVLLAPTTPTKPTSPNPWIIGIGSVLFGLGLGLALAILLEYSKNCFRSARELRRVMPHPVLGTINTIRTRRERARAFLVRSILGGGSLAFVAGAAFVTWAWAKDQSALNDRLVDAIEGFRRMLM